MAASRCRYCGRFFRPDPHQGWRQRNCGRAPCRRAHKSRRNRDWWGRHPSYDQSRRLKLRAWAASYPCYWRRYRAKQAAYRERERQRMRRRRAGLRRVAKQAASRQIAVERLLAARGPERKTVAKQAALSRRVEGLFGFLLWKEGVAKQGPIELKDLPGG